MEIGTVLGNFTDWGGGVVFVVVVAVEVVGRGVGVLHERGVAGYGGFVVGGRRVYGVPEVDVLELGFHQGFELFETGNSGVVLSVDLQVEFEPLVTGLRVEVGHFLVCAVDSGLWSGLAGILLEKLGFV